ncbi:MAG: hypothetical protein FJ087_13185 [Deltaproteobacteria bacterium]|nr:hypothetical protein [Deltaproteobacteria bacterium]
MSEIAHEPDARQQLWSQLTKAAEKANKELRLRIGWKAKPEVSFDVVVVDGSPRVEVTAKVIEMLAGVDVAGLKDRLAADQWRRWEGCAGEIRSQTGKTVGLSTAACCLVPALAATTRTTINLNVYRNLAVLDGLDGLFPAADGASQAKLSDGPSLSEIAETLGIAWPRRSQSGEPGPNAQTSKEGGEEEDETGSDAGERTESPELLT